METKDRVIEKATGLTEIPKLGVSVIDNDNIRISIWLKDASSCKLNIYNGARKVQRITIPAMKTEGMSDLFAANLYGSGLVSKLNGLTYDFSIDGETVVDPYAEAIEGRNTFGKRSRERGRFVLDSFDWKGENRKVIPAKDMVMYECHMRGFTRHKSSGVANPGTFDGMREKIPYLKKLGVNTIFLLPVYDFDETAIRPGSDGEKRVNYWGYTKEAYYYAPKAAYSSDKMNPGREFKTLVKELHRNGMNVVMDMFFGDVTSDAVGWCLRYYAVKFHIDGFRINPGAMDFGIVRKDPVLSHVRFFNYAWDGATDNSKDVMLFEMNDQFKEDARRFVKSDEGQVDRFYHEFRAQRAGYGRVNYVTAHDGFTLRDLISYDIKHNEANGERNLDGTDYNYSWNCGAEGPTRRKAVLRMREKQEKNILAMLILGLPIPKLLAGDEFGNSQKGNNNAYCQDNATTWLDWNLLEKNKKLFDYIRYLLKLRRELPIYSREDDYSGFDHKGLGAPDISCHGREPWHSNFPFYSRELGIMFYGPYLDDKPAKSYYLAFNMYWETHDFFLPDITKDRKWEVVLDTAACIRKDDGLNEERTAYRMEGRSVVLLSCEEEKKRTDSRKTRSTNAKKKTATKSAAKSASRAGTKRRKTG